MATAAREMMRRSRKPSQPTLIETSPRRPTHHNGALILEEELIMHLPNAPLRLSRVHLENGNTAFACRDCDFTADMRGDVMAHRNREHGTRIGKKPVQVKLPEPDPELDIVLAPRVDGTPAPDDLMNWTFAELLAVAPSIAALGNMVDRYKQAADEAAEVVSEYNQNKAKLEAYEDEHEELKAARLQLRQQSNYEEMKAELHRLRNWKRKMTTKLKNIGLQLSEEED